MIGYMAKAMKANPVQTVPLEQIVRQWLIPLQSIVMLGTSSFVIGVMGALIYTLVMGASAPAVTPYPVANFNNPPVSEHVNPPLINAISPIFTPEVQHWSGKIIEWSRLYDIDPNMLATVIQIESCGDWQAGSVAGAQGLFQVMPFHFANGEDSKDPDTNAKRGIAYLKESLAAAGGHFGLALAGYNGGIGVINAGWARWADETKRYYVWGSNIYKDTVDGKTQSEYLQNWLDSGGANLCGQAAARIANPPTAQPVGQNTGS